jgi:hypothetical protein
VPIVNDCDADLTIVVAPREKYSRARAVLEALLAQDAPPFRLVWVDEARVPRRLGAWMHEQSLRAGFRYVSLRHCAGANECRALGMELAATPFVLLLDNDAFLGPGSLAALCDCMRSSGASFVAPVYLEDTGSVHHAGGPTAVVDGPGGRELVEDLLCGSRGTALRSQLVRTRSGSLEMHGVLVRASSLTVAAGLDACLLSSMDCADLSLRLGAVDGGGWLEPAATITYARRRLHPSDLPLYVGRWSRASVEHDIARFAATWDLDPRGARLEQHRGFLRMRRMRAVRYLRGAVRRTLGDGAAARFEHVIEPVLDRLSDARRCPVAAAPGA